MSKIEIKTILKNKTDIHKYFGKAIKNGNSIVYSDNNISTKIIIDDIISIERKKDYYIKLNFQKDIKIKKDSIKIEYNLIINNVFVDTFCFSLQYTIDR